MTNVINEIAIFVITASILISYYLTSSYFIKDIKTNMLLFTLFVVIFTMIIYAVFSVKNNKKSNFLFEVTPNKPTCGIGYYGLPRMNFNYVPDSDRMDMPYLQTSQRRTQGVQNASR